MTGPAFVLAVLGIGVVLRLPHFLVLGIGLLALVSMLLGERSEEKTRRHKR